MLNVTNILSFAIIISYFNVWVLTVKENKTLKHILQHDLRHYLELRYGVHI